MDPETKNGRAGEDQQQISALLEAKVTSFSYNELHFGMYIFSAIFPCMWGTC
jgi:hypothetical protein